MRRKDPVLCSHPLLRIVARKEDTIFVGRRKKDVAKECFTVQGRSYKVMHQYASGSNRRERIIEYGVTHKPQGQF